MIQTMIKEQRLRKRHILLCGDVQVGKSTLISRLLEQIDQPVYGFITKKAEPDACGVSPVYLHPAGLPEERRSYGKQNLVGTCAGKIQSIFPEVFDTLGVACIRAAKPGGILVMDELGVMEAGSEAFTKAVLDALDGDIPVLAAVKSRTGIPFLEQVRACPKADLFSVTESSRDMLFMQLLPRLREAASLPHRPDSPPVFHM